MGGGGGGGDPAAYQREQDRKRQQRISQGKQQLEQIFGELEGKKRVAKYDYLNLDENELRKQVSDILSKGQKTVRSGSGKNQNTSTTLTPKAQAQLDRLGIGVVNNTQQVQGKSVMGRYNTGHTVTTPSFNVADYLNKYRSAKNNPNSYTMQNDPNAQPIWQQQESAFMDYANPQLNDQYQDAQGELGFALLRQGQQRGSVAGDRRADLNRDFQIQQQGVAEQARGYGNQARADIASQKSALLNMLNANADPGATAMAARASLDSLRSQPAFSPLGPLFQNATAGLAAGMGGAQARQQRQQYNDIVYGGDPDASSGRVRR